MSTALEQPGADHEQDSIADLIERDWRRGAVRVSKLPRTTAYRRAAAVLVCTCARQEADSRQHPQLAHGALHLLGPDFRIDPELREITGVLYDAQIDEWKGAFRKLGEPTSPQDTVPSSGSPLIHLVARAKRTFASLLT